MKRRVDWQNKRRDSHIYHMVDLLLRFDKEIRLRDVGADTAVVIRQLLVVCNQSAVELHDMGILAGD